MRRMCAHRLGLDLLDRRNDRNDDCQNSCSLPRAHLVRDDSSSRRSTHPARSVRCMGRIFLQVRRRYELLHPVDAHDADSRKCGSWRQFLYGCPSIGKGLRPGGNGGLRSQTGCADDSRGWGQNLCDVHSGQAWLGSERSGPAVHDPGAEVGRQTGTARHFEAGNRHQVFLFPVRHHRRVKADQCLQLMSGNFSRLATSGQITASASLKPAQT